MITDQNIIIFSILLTIEPQTVFFIIKLELLCFIYVCGHFASLRKNLRNHLFMNEIIFFAFRKTKIFPIQIMFKPQNGFGNTLFLRSTARLHIYMFVKVLKIKTGKPHIHRLA